MARPVTSASMTGFLISQAGIGDVATRTSMQTLVQIVSPESLSQSRSCAWPSGLIFENHIDVAKTCLQQADEKLRKDEIIKLPHWKHDSTFSDRKPRMPSRGDLHQSPSGPDAQFSTLTPKSWVKNLGGGQERSSLGPNSRQFFLIIRTGYEVSLENSKTTPYTINGINLGKIC